MTHKNATFKHFIWVYSIDMVIGDQRVEKLFPIRPIAVIQPPVCLFS